MKQFKYFFLFVMLFFTSEIIFAKYKDISLTKKITVYYYPTCAGCKFVVNTINSRGWNYRIKLIDATPKNEKDNLRKLRDDGRAAGPFLVDEIHNQKIAGGYKIVEYLKKLFE